MYIMSSWNRDVCKISIWILEKIIRARLDKTSARIGKNDVGVLDSNDLKTPFQIFIVPQLGRAKKNIKILGELRPPAHSPALPPPQFEHWIKLLDNWKWFEKLFRMKYHIMCPRSYLHKIIETFYFYFYSMQTVEFTIPPSFLFSYLSVESSKKIGY